MKKILGTIALVFAFSPSVQAEESVGDKAHQVKEEAIQAKRAAGKNIRHVGHEIKAAGRHTRQAVIVRCGDGRHAVKRDSACAGHGGVQDPK